MKYFTMVAVLGLALIAAPYAHAQRIVVGVGFGPQYVGQPPACVYGYYDYAPYACAPYGYYGPEWFSSGVFIGAGPWYREYYGRPFVRRDFDDRWHGFGDRDHDRDFRGGDFHGRDFHGNDFRGGDFHGRSFQGEDSRGGNFHGQGFQGGGSRGGGFHGGESRGGGGSHGGGRR